MARNKFQGLQLRIRNRESKLSHYKQARANPATQFLRDHPNFYDSLIEDAEKEIQGLRLELERLKRPLVWDFSHH